MKRMFCVIALIVTACDPRTSPLAPEAFPEPRKCPDGMRWATESYIDYYTQKYETRRVCR